ncbi:MAG: acetylxylan esterase, partial [Collinsella sp.]|nr:acetylxylan esterase [Collinsella sp.]
VRGSVLMGTSLMDAVSDPKGQFAVFNGLECDRRHIIYAKYAHERINAFENEVVDFFNQAFYLCSLA